MSDAPTHAAAASLLPAEHRPGRSGRAAWTLATLLVIAILPLLLRDSYARGVLIAGALNVIQALGLDLILGFAGQLDLGAAAFYGIGAYVSTLLMMLGGLGFWPALALGTLAAGLMGGVLALLTARLRGHYLAIASLGFAVITYQVLLNWISVTQGPLGLYGLTPPAGFADPVRLFYLIAGAAVLVFAALRALLASPVGAALAALREDEISAASLGIDCRRWKVFAFALGSAVAGLAGGLYPGFAGTLVPDAFAPADSFGVLAMVIVGGVGTLSGPVLGAVVLTLAPELLRSLGDARMIVYGLALTLVVMFMPGGLHGAWRMAAARLRR